jgi:peptidyl-prolyl cis-trans isomerase SurA
VPDPPVGDPDLTAVDSANEAAASHILITHAESHGHPDSVTRSRAEAENLARNIAVQTRLRRASFPELARKYSEDPQAQKNGGYLGILRRGELLVEFEVALFNMEVGQVGVVVETELGFHVLKRHPVRRVRAHHLLVAWREARNVTGAVRRTYEQARILAAEVRQQAAAGADLCELTSRFSDDPNNRTRCGDLGVIEPQLLPEAFDQALFRLKPGEVSEVVETEFGFHIIWRD